GNYTISEQLPSGWSLGSIVCEGGSPSLNGTSVTVTIIGGANIACTFTHLIPPPTVILTFTPTDTPTPTASATPSQTPTYTPPNTLTPISAGDTIRASVN